MCRFSSFSSLSHFLFSRDFSGTIAGTNITNTTPEPSRPTDVPFVGYVMDMSSCRPTGASVARLVILVSGARSRSWN